jgi:outer membrane receptor protein involved in Fe transport
MTKLADRSGVSPLRDAWKFLLAPSCVALLATAIPGAALAQEEEIEEVVVTGSRLVRRDLDAPSPVVVIDSTAIQNAGNVTIEETLNEMPQLASDNTSSVNSGGGSGILTADLRGLDAVRTLVLVNGRRFAPADSRGLTDLTSIPDALVERVEIMTGGASAVYGSDAIAGAVNFILKDDFEGLEFGYYLGETSAGDATTQKFDLTIGGNFADGRGNAVVSTSYTDRGKIFFADRDYSATSLFESGGTLVPGGSSNLPGTRLSLNSTQLGSLQGLGFDPATACPGTIGGVRFGDQGAVVPFCDPEDRYNFAPLNYLLRPLERVQITALGHYDINDYVTAYTELAFMDNRNEWQQAPNAGGLQTSGATRGSYLIPDFATNPVLFDATRQFLVANTAIFDPDGDGTAELIQTGRRSVETGPRNYKYDRTSYNALAGLKGDFEAGGRQWSWDTFFQYQRAKTDEDIAGQLSQLRLSLGSDVTVDPAAPGGVRCTNQFVGCVPVNFLGLNSVTPEAAAFISPNHGVTNVLERQVYGGFISGDLFEMPAGPLAFGIGFEERVDRYDFRPDTAAQGGEFGDPQPPIEASIDLTEFFAEARVPLLQGAPGAEILDLELAVRTSDYSTIGNVTTWKAGIEWAPIDSLRIRGAFNQAIRSPNLDELFATVAIGFSAGDDLCDKDLNPTQEQKNLCVQQGILASEIDNFDQTNVGFGVRSGGNPNLKEEKADTWTIGAVWTPNFADGLSITLDYYNIEITSAINQLSAQQVVNNCFRPDNLDNSSDTCQAINRFANGQIDFVDARSLNVASVTANGVDLQVDYALDLGNTLAMFGPAGMNFQFFASWALENETVAEPGQPGLDCLGYFGGSFSGFNVFMQPDTKYIFNWDYFTGDFSSRFQWRSIPSLDLFPTANNAVKSISGVNYLDLNFDYTFADRYTVFLGMDNILDDEPPVVGFSLAGDANVDISLYDTLGRRYYGGIRVRL